MKRICLVPLKVKLLGNVVRGEKLNSIPQGSGRSSLGKGNAKLMSVLQIGFLHHRSFWFKKVSLARVPYLVNQCNVHNALLNVHQGVFRGFSSQR